MADFEYLFVDRTEPVDTELEVEGALPGGLSGTFYAVGGAGTRVGETALHGLDAHGRVTAVTLGGGRGRLSAKMVETPLFGAERAKQAMAKRRVFTNKPARWSNLFDVDLGNNAVHNVIPWGGRLVVANDPGFFVLDPASLETVGPAPVGPKKGATFSPMPRRDPRTGRHVVFEHRPGLRDTLVVRELDDAFSVAAEQSYALPRGASLFHDVAFTESWYAVVAFGALSVPGALWGARPFFEAVRFGAEIPVLYLLPRAGGAAVPIPLPGALSHFHFWNAHEVDGRVVLDAIGYPSLVNFSALHPPKARAAVGVRITPTPASRSVRYVVDAERREARAEPLSEVPAEAPAIREDRRGRGYRYGWAPTSGGPGDEEDRGAYFWFHALARHDFAERRAELWDAGPRTYVSPAAFVPRGEAEDDGWVLALLQDAAAGTTSLAVFEAWAIGKGPVARLRAPGLIGMVSHVAFA